jgi:hypothetical protein
MNFQQMNFLLLITQGAGIFLMIATMILLFFRRIYLDAETKQPITFQFPIIGQISTQAPVLVIILIGVFMIVYPLSKMDPNTAMLRGNVDAGGKPITLLVVAEPDYVHSYDASGAFNFEIPLLPTGATYRVKYIVDKLIIADNIATEKNGVIEMPLVQWKPQAPDTLSTIPTKKEVPDEVLQKLSITN